MRGQAVAREAVELLVIDGDLDALGACVKAHVEFAHRGPLGVVNLTIVCEPQGARHCFAQNHL